MSHARGARLQVAKHAVAEHQADGVGDIHARLALHALALDAYNIGAEEHTHEVECIYAEVEQGAAAEVGSHNARFVAHRVAQRGGYQVRLSDASATYQVAHDAHGRLVACPDGLAQEYFALAGHLDDFFCLPAVGHKGLLHQARFVVEQRFHCYVVVVGMGGGNIYQVYILVGYQRRIRPVSLGNLPFGGKSVRLFL